MDKKNLTTVALRYRAVFLDVNREDIRSTANHLQAKDLTTETSVPVLAFLARLKENGFCVSEELLHALNAVSANRLAEITEYINHVMPPDCIPSPGSFPPSSDT